MKKKLQVSILPTEHGRDKFPFTTPPDDNLRGDYRDWCFFNERLFKDMIVHYLYLTAPDPKRDPQNGIKIQMEDWVLVEGKYVEQVRSIGFDGYITTTVGRMPREEACRKIIATNDIRLWSLDYKRMGKLGNKFVETYAERRGAIAEVLVEFDEDYDLHYYMSEVGEQAKRIDKPDKLKKRPNGTVHLTPVLLEDMSPKQVNTAILEIIKEESEKSNVRQYTCMGHGYSQFERNIAERVINFFQTKEAPYESAD